MSASNNIEARSEFQKLQKPDLIWLTDNGSLKPDATLALRKLCQATSEILGQPIEPVSLLHSSKIGPELLHGEQARTFERSIKAAYEAGQKHVRIQPLFFGPSAALTEYLPERLRILLKKRPELQVDIAPALVPEKGPTPDWLLEVLSSHAEALLSDHPEIKHWLLVDHGSPRQEVAAVRDRVAADFQSHWKRSHADHAVYPASMERRDGDEYSFCDPLLERAPSHYDIKSGEIGVLMLFFLPGRHAGPCGDVAEIIEGVEYENSALKLHMSPLFAEHSKLAEALAKKIQSELQQVAS